jgi:cytochrome c oxidase cbb3-type subunit 4
MASTYLALANFAQTWGLIYFVVVFVLMLAYVMRPSGKAKYEDAARIPLKED